MFDVISYHIVSAHSFFLIIDVYCKEIINAFSSFYIKIKHYLLFFINANTTQCTFTTMYIDRRQNNILNSPWDCDKNEPLPRPHMTQSK